MKKISFVILIALILNLFTIGNINAQNLNIKLIRSFDSQINTIYIASATILIGTDEGLYYTSDNFKTLRKKNEGLTELSISAIDYYNGKYYIGTDGGGLYLGSLEDAQWISLRNLVDCPTISSIKHEGDRIYVASYCSGFFASFNKGSTFLNLNKGLSSVKASAFLIASSGYYLGTDEGFYYAKTISEGMVWNKVLNNVSVNSVSEFNGVVLVGTSSGIYSGSENKFEKINIVSGSPNIKFVEAHYNRVIVGIDSLGLFLSCDAVNYFLNSSELFFDVRTVAFDSDKKLIYVGTKSGKLYSVDLSTPILLFNKTINLGTVRKGSVFTFSFDVFDFSFNTQELSLSGPNFIQFTKTSSGNKINFCAKLDSSKLAAEKYSVPLVLKKGSVEEKVFVNFEVVENTEIVVRLYIGSTTAYINDKEYKLDAPPFIDKISNRTLVPVRFISEALGFDVLWDGIKKEVTIKNRENTTEIKLYINKTTATVNGKSIALDVAPVILPPGRTFVPIRFISETFKGTVYWDSKTKEVKIVF
ncbi:copper amine oxidase N-terminal domain-containing protein [Caldisericum exile]|uniref:copper amine oxidase N-terminal domain-containing protein n=1 Tax=Caldisericum exile TaxID=693075 RepID=UPI00155A656A|nr:copper amine oxidase N-terminal domain-containing protein [Caldisericum exile]